MKKGKIYNSEIIAYSVLGVVWFLGLVLCVLGVAAYNVGKLSNNNIYAFEKALATFFKMEGKVIDLRLVGSVVMIVAMIGFLIAIYAFTNKQVTEAAEERRRAERRRILMEEDEASSAE